MRQVSSLPKKLYWLHPHFYNWMGGHKYIYEVILLLQKKYDVDVTVITSGLSETARQNFAKAKVPVITLFGFSTNSALYWFGLPIFLWAETFYLKHVKKIDLKAGFISSMFPANALAHRLSHHTAQLCYEPFAFFYDQEFVAGFSFWQKLFIALIKILYQSADRRAVQQNQAVLTISQFNRHWIQQAYNVDAAIVYEGVDTTFFKPTRNTKLSKKYRNQPLVFHSTDYTPIKGTKFLIPAFAAVVKKLPRAKLVISETLPNSPAKKEVLELVRKYKLAKHVEFAGFLPYQLLPAYLSLAKVVVQPSINQSMNLTVKEAMACGTPIITSPEGREQTKNGEAGFLIDPRQTQVLTERILSCMVSTKLSAQMRKRGRTIIQTKFSWDSVTAKIWQNISPIMYG